MAASGKLMAALPVIDRDPTLDCMASAIESEAAAALPRPYLGMSSIGNECARQLWYQFRFFDVSRFDAATLARFDDGHRSEDIVADRLRKVSGIELTTHKPDGKQIGFTDIGGHFRGHMDGLITGLLQAPKTTHVWEHKCTNEAKFKKLNDLKAKAGEKEALEQWDEVYYAQAVLYMYYAELDRHYLTVTTAGSREITSCRTEADVFKARELIAKAETIISAEQAPAKLSKDPSFFKCKWCPFSEICHFGKEPRKTCRNCAHGKPVDGGEWECGFYRENIPGVAVQLAGCSHWRPMP